MGWYSTVTLTNTILADQSAGISVTGGCTLTADGILWHNTPITVFGSPTASVSLQNQHTGDAGFDADGYHLLPYSAAIDRGVDAGWREPVVGLRAFGQRARINVRRPTGGNVPDRG